MKKLVVLLVSSLIALSLVGCGNMNKQDVGTIGGGVAGAILGSQIGGGSGRMIATVGGTLIGAYLGGQVGRSMDEVDRMKVNSALETTPSRQTTSWQNPDSGANYSVTPTRTYYSGGMPCRDYTTTAIIGGKRQTVFGRACRQADGSWQAVNQ